MRRILIWILVTVLIVPSVNAQRIERPLEIGVLFGPAFTVGKPGSSDADTAILHSISKTGINVAITLTYRFPNSVFGIYGIGSWQQNPVDSKEFARSRFDRDTAIVAVHSNPLNSWKFLAGPDLKLPLGRTGKINVQISLVAGAVVAVVPDFTINSNRLNGTEVEYHYGGRLPLTFCYQLSSGINYRVCQRWSIGLNAGYTHSRPAYSGDYEFDGVPRHYTYTYPISSLNVLAGISYSL
jgi:hypothetical protein